MFSSGNDACYVDNIRYEGCEVITDDSGGDSNPNCELMLSDFEGTGYFFLSSDAYDYGWSIAQTDVYAGTYSYQSDDIDDYDTAGFDIVLADLSIAA